MASLTGQTISSTYDSLLKVTDNGPLNSSLKTITDGLGNSSSLQLSTIAAYITGGLTVTGQLTLPGAFDLTVNGFTIGKGPGALNNTVYGFQSLLSNTTGVFNTANGYQALYNNTIGEYNTAFGLQSMFSNVAGGNNVGIGANALPSNTSGNNNTAIGRYAGFGTGTNNNITGSNNIFIGYQSVGISSSESNRTWIGNSSTLATWVGGNLLVGGTTNNGFGLEVTGTAKISGQITLGSTITNGTYTYTLPSATGTIALVGGVGVGTVTSVAALTLGTSGTDLSSTVANGTTTPVITLNVPTASGSNRGVLSSTDWTTFNSKQGTITLTTTGSSGAATFVSNTLNIPQYTVLSLAAIGITPNANGGSIVGSLLSLQPADASFGGVVTTGTQTFAGDKTLTGSLYGIGLSMTGTVGDIIGSVATTGKAIRGTATTGFGVYASATTGTAIYGESTGIGGAGINGTSGNGIGGYFLNNATGFATLYVTNNGSGNLASFSNSAGTKFTINNAGNLGNGTYTYTLPSATGTLALTSALSSYLPLIGGALTGALSGTSATFSGNGSFGGAAANVNPLYVKTATDSNLRITDAAGTLQIAVVNDAVNAHRPFMLGNGWLNFTNTGAATFSGSSAEPLIISTSSSTMYTTYISNSVLLGYIGNGNGIVTGGGATNFGIRAENALLFTAGGNNERMRITSGGNVGIGTTSPNNKLEIINGVLGVSTNQTGEGILYGRIAMYSTGAGNAYINYGGEIRSYSGAGIDQSDLRFYTSPNAGATERMRINSSGDLVVKGTVANISLLGDGVQMHFSRNATNYIIANGGTGSTIRIISNTNGVELSNGATSWIAVSDENLKVMTEWKTFINPLEKIISLRAGTSRYKTDSEDISRSFLIAQDVQKVLPEAVSVDEDGILGLRYTEVIPLMIAAIQEQQAQIEELKALIKPIEPIIPEATTEPIIPTDNNLE